MSPAFGHAILDEIPERIFRLAEKALTTANTQATYYGPGIEHWPAMSLLSACHAGELFVKAAIARHHPLLIFKNTFNFKEGEDEGLTLDTLIAEGRSHDFSVLPTIYWAVSGNKIPAVDVYKEAGKLRNSIQHFVEPDGHEHTEMTLRFLYEVVDPLIAQEFDINAIDYTEGFNDGYDYLVEVLIKRGIRFTMPRNFTIGEVDWRECLGEARTDYVDWFQSTLSARTGKTLEEHVGGATWL